MKRRFKATKEGLTQTNEDAKEFIRFSLSHSVPATACTMGTSKEVFLPAFIVGVWEMANVFVLFFTD